MKEKEALKHVSRVGLASIDELSENRVILRLCDGTDLVIQPYEYLVIHLDGKKVNDRIVGDDLCKCNYPPEGGRCITCGSMMPITRG